MLQIETYQKVCEIINSEQEEKIELQGSTSVKCEMSFFCYENIYQYCYFFYLLTIKSSFISTVIYGDNMSTMLISQYNTFF
jgi:hypothetical protein